MRLTCARAGLLATASLAGQASLADRIALDAHLEACSACREDRRALDVVRSLQSWSSTRLSDVARERVRRSMHEAARRDPASTSRRLFSAPRRSLLVGLGVLAAAFAVALLVRPAPNRVLTGDLRVVGTSGPRIPDGALLRTHQGGRAVFGSVSVDFGANTEATWNDGARAVALARGDVTVDVTPGKGQHFQVVTRRFTVEVVGTRFSVDLAGVATDHGTVRVRSPEGSLLATLTAGQRWSVEPPPAPATAAVPTTPTGGAVPSIPGSADTRACDAPVAAIPSARGGGASPAERLARARDALARGEADRARSLVAPLIGGARRSDVEARLVVAESHLVEGRYADAMDGYRKVVRDFRGSHQAESALFAIAELQVEIADRAHAAETLRRYLLQYPEGRFAKEARERLAVLRPASPR